MGDSPGLGVSAVHVIVNSYETGEEETGEDNTGC